MPFRCFRSTLARWLGLFASQLYYTYPPYQLRQQLGYEGRISEMDLLIARESNGSAA